ncbi:hypothetical protein Lepto7375DRAFT_1768 [Leptolyngbya sp. PCC 7375]|nr:hypothetical protein Lepto7375DRAFT_1768 [Leptolyngbya sp. PCC 7375]
MTRKLILFYADSGDDSKDYATLVRGDDRQELRLLAQYYDSSNKPIPNEGYRLSEYKRGEIGGVLRPTHHRPGPWMVEIVENYVPDLPIGTEFGEVVICTCGYSPLPEAENPWIEMIQRQVSEEQLVSA